MKTASPLLGLLLAAALIGCSEKKSVAPLSTGSPTVESSPETNAPPVEIEQPDP